MARKPDPENQQAKFNIGTLKIATAEILQFKAALNHYGWLSIAAFLRQCAIALIRQYEKGEPILQPLQFRVAADIVPLPVQRRRYGHTLETVAADQVARENQSDA